MLDYFARHVANVQGAVRTAREEHRSEPVVARRQELGSVEKRHRRKRCTARFEPVHVNQISSRVAGKHGSEKLGRQISALPNIHPASRAECSGMRISRSDILTDRENPRSARPAAQQVILRGLGTVLNRIGECEVRVMSERIERHHDVLHLDAVHADKASSKKVYGMPVLTPTRNRIKTSGSRVVTQITL